MKQERNKNFKQGFTLLELLVVVLIIGILAAIALPQYKMAVGKSKFSELKITTKALQQAVQRYYLVHNTYDGITIDSLDIEKPQDLSCPLGGLPSYIRCTKTIFSKNVSFVISQSTGLPLYCIAYSTDHTDKANRLCQIETNTKQPSQSEDHFTRYSY